MTLDLIKMKSKVNCDLCFVLSPHKITELLVLGSACYFLMATEKRFQTGTLEVDKMKIS